MVGFVLGLIAGFIPLMVPNRFLYQDEITTMDGATFAESQPDRAEIRWVFPVLYFLTILVVYFVLTPWQRQHAEGDFANVVNYLFTFALFAVVAILTGLFELVTEVSPIYGGKTLVSFRYIVGDPVRRAGMTRIILAGVMLFLSYGYYSTTR